MNVTYKQKELLLNILQDKSELVRGRVDRKSESRKKLNTLWDEVAVQVNAVDEGPQKSGKEWAKTWKDIKGYILKKEAKRRSYTQGTGGGPPPKIAFSNFEEDVLKLLTPEAAGLENIAEGGIANEIISNNITYDVEQINPENAQAEEIEMRADNEQDLEIHLAAREVEEYENIPPNQNSLPIRNARRVAGSSIQQLSRDMIDMQSEKLQLKKKEIELREETLKVHKKILCELKNIRSLLATSDTNSETIDSDT